MEVRFIVPAMNAAIDKEERTHVFGAFSHLKSATLPVRLGQLVFVISMCGFSEDSGKHFNFKVRLRQPDMPKEIWDKHYQGTFHDMDDTPEGTVMAGHGTAKFNNIPVGDIAEIKQIVSLDKLELYSYGIYRFELDLDDGQSYGTTICFQRATK